jgi:type II secretory pathway component GspD/PulD (secretin)
VDSTGALPARALTSDEIDERLSGPLPKVRFVKVPLAQFIEFINDFSGLTIVIDERALAKVSKNRETLVTVKLADTTARDALRSAVNSLGLTCVVRDGQLIVTAVSK